MRSLSSSSSGSRWATPTDQRDVVITEQLALIKNLNETIQQQKQVRAVPIQGTTIGRDYAQS